MGGFGNAVEAIVAAIIMVWGVGAGLIIRWGLDVSWGVREAGFGGGDGVRAVAGDVAALGRGDFGGVIE